MKKLWAICGLMMFCVLKVSAQCTTLGQNPATAFPVCGTTVFSQTTVPICSSNDLYVPGCSNADYENKNPFWYKFTCFSSGTLGFTITPNTPSDDYDWQLYDITGHDPNDIFTVRNLVVTGNWSGSSGNTGAAAGGVNFIQCASSPQANAPTFAAMPTLVLGHEYLLVISHFTNSQSGYALSFGGGTASITDPKLPKMDTAFAPCDGSEIIVKLNKRMKCNSISTQEFTIEPPLATITSVTGIGCDASFDMESVRLTLSPALTPGFYKVRIFAGTDNNTLLDNCERMIPENDSLELTIAPVFPTPMDSLIPPGCAPQVLELVFDKRIRCNSIAANGSDFTVTGPYTAIVASAAGDCVDGLTSRIFVTLSQPLYTAGTFTIRLQQGTDGGTITDECGQATPPGFPISFVLKDTVNANFSYSTILGCTSDTVKYFHNGANTVNSWHWQFDGQLTSLSQHPAVAYNIFGSHLTQLIVTNGVCTDTVMKEIFLRNTLKAKFDAMPLVCPDEPVVFKDLSVAASPGNQLVSWNWDFANGNSSNQQYPPAQVYEEGTVNYYAPVRLIVEDFLGCKDTAVINLNILNNCYIDVPTAFTPNGDGLNDLLYPLNAYKATNLSFSIYNRLGQKLFFTRDWTKQWDGRYRGQGSDPGTYVWVLDYFNTLTNRQVFKKGYTVLIR